MILSALTYLVHYAIFRDARHIFSYVLTDLAFLPIEVLLVTMIIHELLTLREKKARLEKLNMVIGLFFSETGTHLLGLFSSYDPGIDKIRDELVRGGKEEGFGSISSRLTGYGYDVDIRKVDLEKLRGYFAGKRDFLTRMLENPALLEHESFTDLLLAVFHLIEELTQRGDLKNLPEPDLDHLKGDIERAYTRLVIEWLSYMRHLKENYPYLFSLAVRTNPFDMSASPVVR